MTTFALDPPAPAGACVTLMLMRNVKNMNAVVARMRSGELCMAIVDARMVLSVAQLRLAATTAAIADAQGSLRSRTIFSEMVCALSPQPAIGEALRKFGVHEASTDAWVLLLRGSSASLQSADEAAVEQTIDGEAVPCEEWDGAVESLCDRARLCSTFKLGQGAAQWPLPVLEGHILTGMAMQGLK